MDSTRASDVNRETRINEAVNLFQVTKRELGKRIVGQTALIEGLVMGVVAGGHVLLEGVPGLAKTLAIKTLAEVMGLDFRRIQFTPDLLPADLIGTMVYRQQTGEFLPRKGPVFSNFILADEINRAPAKVQSALLEAMAENQVTIGENTFALPDPFFVLATQNPIDQEGTYSLPESQLDRFMVKLVVDYPTPEEELHILKVVAADRDDLPPLQRVLDTSGLMTIRRALSAIRLDEKIETYIVAIVHATREKDRRNFSFARFIEYGASPRASIALYRLARVKALFEGRGFVLPEDVKAVAPAVLRHRLVLSYEAEAEDMKVDDVVRILLSAVAIP
ncbi:MAG: MoxR family ATPase [Spirochaetales bacterium]|nr:MoxR family ATPase [Spirochaetales bacterium]